MFVGLLGLVCLETRPLSGRAWATCATVVAVMAIGSTAISVASPYIRHKQSRHLFPGKALAAQVDEAWRSRYGRPLPIVAGDYYLAGTVAFFDPNRPRVYESEDEPIDDVAVHDCPWLSDDEFSPRGWRDPLETADFTPTGFRPKCSSVLGSPSRWSWPRYPNQTAASVPPARIGMAIVPPPSKNNRRRHPSDRRVGYAHHP